MCNDFLIVDLNGLPILIYDGMLYQLYRICFSIVVVFNLQQLLLVDGICRPRLDAEIYVTINGLMYWR